MIKKRQWRARDTVFVGVLAAMCVIATTLKIPLGAGGMVHLGSAFVFLVALVFGGAYAGLAGAVGSALFDLVMGSSPYTVWSFVIKGIAGLTAGIIAKGLWPENNKTTVLNEPWFWRGVAGCLAASIWTLGGYILAWRQVTGSWTVAIGNAPSSLLTSGVGIVVALVLAPKLRNRRF